ncbi:glycoside hydrolase family 15 [Acetobacter cibinongensis]|uniref:Glycoside hydrolase family 15 n=1 Tax=Acetobacter cibinongensis TaxID=146475 RepID=A0A0D6MZI4_9PROT|nr:glycoside hydrolase family 15 protein [Acetobacter cibinongensis]GAN59094.1 glycosyl hydrolase [Acetobacter cibinongensis]GEL58958.1 glycoside hydrolase family 15 [Acetobacter cibinongensis]
MTKVASGQKDDRLVPQRTTGYLPLEDYGALGDGRSVALSGTDGSIDWWGVPNLDSPPLFDRLLDANKGGYFSIQPTDPFSVERHYLKDSNVLVTFFHTQSGSAKLTESLNSSYAGRLPWSELARRVEGISGEISFRFSVFFSTRDDTASPYFSKIGDFPVFHIKDVLGLFLHSESINSESSDEGISGHFMISEGERKLLAIVAGQSEPLVVPTIADIDGRIDISHHAWQEWVKIISYDGIYRNAFVRSALSLKFLLFSPSGAIAAAATTSLPEKIGNNKNYDYRYAWVRDAGYTINAFLAINAQADAKAAFTWLLERLQQHGSHVCYTLAGDLVDEVYETNLAGYRNSRPVVTGNLAASQHQHGIYGDIFGTAWCFVSKGNILDPCSAELLSHLADECADNWRQKDAGIWELPKNHHYTSSKISCWQALARAVELADCGQLPTTCRERWGRERDRIEQWIEENCWSDQQQAYVMYPGCEKLDASLALAVQFRYPATERLSLTMEALDRELGAGPFHYRYSEVDKEEGCFLACSFWIAEAKAHLGQNDDAARRLDNLVKALDRGVGIWSEMVDPKDLSWLGNIPQGLTHLAFITALETLSEKSQA